MPMDVAGKPIRELRYILHSGAGYPRGLRPYYTHTHDCMLAHFNLRVQPQAASESASESESESEAKAQPQPQTLTINIQIY